jgi:hypothetical protein
MAGNRLFNPGDSLTLRDPLDDNRANKNVINPPRFAELGGLNAAHKTSMYRNQAGLYRNNMTIRRPGQTQREVPMDSNKPTNHGPTGGGY